MQTFAAADINHDNIDDLIMVVWKKGSFGRDKPFWLNHNDWRFSNHLFVYDLVENQLKPVWMSSALSLPIKSLQIEDYNNDRKNELIVEEGSYTILPSFLHKNDSYSYWQWNGWGFFKLEDET